MEGTRREALAWVTGGALVLTAAEPVRAAARARPRLGMNLYLFTDAVTPEFYPLLRTLKRLGFDGVEIPITRGHAERFGELRRVLDDEGLACTTLSSLKPEANPVSPDARVRAAAVDALRWAIDTGHQLGSRTLSGPLYAASGTFTGKAPTPDELARSADVLAQACAYARPASQTLCLEFLNRFEAYLVNTVAQTLVLIERAGADNLAIAYDTHHAHIEEGSAAGSIRAAGAKLHHTHQRKPSRHARHGPGQLAGDLRRARRDRLWWLADGGRLRDRCRAARQIRACLARRLPQQGGGRARRHRVSPQVDRPALSEAAEGGRT